MMWLSFCYWKWERGPCRVLSLLQYGNGHLLVVQQCSKLPLIVRQDETRTHTNLNLGKHTIHKDDLSSQNDTCVFPRVVYNALGWVRQGTERDWASAWGWGCSWIHTVDIMKMFRGHTHSVCLACTGNSVSKTLCLYTTHLQQQIKFWRKHDAAEFILPVHQTEISQQLLGGLLWNFVTCMFSSQLAPFSLGPPKFRYIVFDQIPAKLMPLPLMLISKC